MAKSIVEKINSIRLSISDIRQNNPNWSEPMVEFIAELSEDLKKVAEEVSDASAQASMFNVEREAFTEALIQALAKPDTQVDGIIPFLAMGGVQVRVISGSTTISNGQSLNVNINDTVDPDKSFLDLKVVEGDFQQFSGGDYYVALPISVGGRILANGTQINLIASNVSFTLDGGSLSSPPTSSTSSVAYWTILEFI
jgi:hypothetical protein